MKVYIHFDNYANIISVFEAKTNSAKEMHLLLFKILNAYMACIKDEIKAVMENAINN